MHRELRFLLVCTALMLCASSVFASDLCPMTALCAIHNEPISAEKITQYPDPNAVVERLQPNLALLQNTPYRRVTDLVYIYDRPNGNIIHTRQKGNYFVTIIETREGWTQINPGQWIESRYLSDDAPLSELTGVFLPETTPYRFGWLREDAAPRTSPNGSIDNTLLPKYTLVYVYAETEVRYNTTWAQIGVNQWVERSKVAVIEPVAPIRQINTPRWVGVDLTEQVLIAYEGSKPVMAALVATGIPDTPTQPGLFRVYDRYDQTPMDSKPDEPFYFMEDVPFTMYFNGNMALHGAYWHDEFGNVRSHGCVNMSLTDAEWVYHFFLDGLDFENMYLYNRPLVYVYW
jgi:hypothetical protein